MADDPDYGKYTLAELYDAQGHIDRDRYPERAAVIDRTIATLQSRQDSAAAVRPSHWPRHITKRSAGAFLGVSGAVSLARLLDLQVPPGIHGHALYFGGAVIYSLMLVGGVLLFTRRAVGLWLGIAAMIPQLLTLKAGAFVYTVTSFPTLEIKLWPVIGFAMTTGQQITIGLAESGPSFYIGFNMTANVIVGTLAFQIEQRRRAKERLRTRRDTDAG